MYIVKLKLTKYLRWHGMRLTVQLSFGLPNMMPFQPQFLKYLDCKTALVQWLWKIFRVRYTEF